VIIGQQASFGRPGARDKIYAKPSDRRDGIELANSKASSAKGMDLHERRADAHTILLARPRHFR